ncbi:MAG: GNAT family N-acetyltransferase, partial [Candidatus Electrothrix sp. AW3_4]|nr:GNAT family N-acetyltransferase [Candidatus Electrothrix gigas]
HFILQEGNFSDNDIQQLVQIHRTELHQGFLSSLGDNALELFFSFAAESRHCLLLTAKDAELNQQVGFLLGTLNLKSFYKDFFRKKALKAAWVLLPKLFSVSTVRKLIEVIFYPAKKEVYDFPEAELLDIAISKPYQGNGLAKKLFYTFSAHLKNAGIKELKITTGKELTTAQRFYERLGAVKIATIVVHQGQETWVYLYNTSV